MEPKKALSRWLAVAGIVAMALFCVGFTAAAVDDYLRSDIVPNGASVSGIPIGGMTRGAAAEVVASQVVKPLMAPVSVNVTGQSVALDPARFLSIDIDAMIDEAMGPKRTASLPERVAHRVSGAPMGHDVSVTGAVDEVALRAWVAEQKKLVAVPARNASVAVEGSKLRFIEAKAGSSIDVTAAAAALSFTLREGGKSVELPVKTVQPKVTADELGKTILVDQSKRLLTLYDGTKVEKRIHIAVGMPQYPTPLGEFKIIRKVRFPTWTNNGSDWAKNMPAYIGPGINNPLGTRALYLNSPGIRIHGIPTSENFSIGQAASHGCMRVKRADIEALYPLVPVGTKVFIVR
jgi:lipoprotein-anchoring transpeptidase ErfK/SrfK